MVIKKKLKKKSEVLKFYPISNSKIFKDIKQAYIFYMKIFIFLSYKNYSQFLLLKIMNKKCI